MELRVKEICKEKGLLFKDLAERIGVSDVALRKQVQGNPTIDTLQKIADALQVNFIELFSPIDKATIGVIRHNGKIYEINSISDIENLLEEIKKAE